MPRVSELGRLLQGNCEFKASLNYVVIFCLKKPKIERKEGKVEQRTDVILIAYTD